MKLTDEQLRVQYKWYLNWELVLVFYQTSYWKLHSAGFLNREAARTLINTAENMTNHKEMLLLSLHSLKDIGTTLYSKCPLLHSNYIIRINIIFPRSQVKSQL